MESMTGTIKRFTDKGYGFIAAPDGVEYFFHQSACTSTPFDSMREGDNVTFNARPGPEGPPRRERLTRLATRRLPATHQGSACRKANPSCSQCLKCRPSEVMPFPADGPKSNRLTYPSFRVNAFSYRLTTPL